MPLLLHEELAKQLDLPVDDVSNALSELLGNIKSDIDSNNPVEMPGIGTFKREGDSISFTPAETLAMSVNNRYAALDSEMIQLGFEEPEFPISETLEEGNEQEVDQSLIDQIIADDMASQGLFRDDGDTDPEPVPIDESGLFANSPKDKELDNSNIPTTDALSPEPDVDSAFMKEDDPNLENRSEKDPKGSDSEWSPFFEELEGEEFDIDNTIDLSAEDWQAEIPPPPSSPFASSSDSSNTNADDLYFDVDADPDDTLFSPASIDVEDPNTSDDMSWASAPLDDVTDFFEDDPNVSSSFGEEIDSLSSMSAEDEFFSPVSGSADVSPDDTMFSPESIYSEEATTEADDTIFLAPEQTIQDATISSEMDDETLYAPPAIRDDNPPAEPRTRNPYAYREQHNRQKKASKGGFPWIALALGAIVILGGAGVAYFGLPAFFGGTTDTPTNQNGSETASQTPATTPEIDPVVDPPGSTAAVDTENGVTPEVNPATNTTPQEQNTPPQEATPPPPVERISINVANGGWTVIVSSEEQRAAAEQIADDFAQDLGALRFPIDILTTNQFETTRYRVAIGQFGTRNEALAFLNRSGSDLPGDAWLLRIE